MSLVSLVYVSWNARPFLERALETSRVLGVPTVVVDNASTDGTAEHVRLRHPEVSLIAADLNLGFAGGVNAGVRETTSAWVVLLNPDILLMPDALAMLLRAGEHDASIGAVGAQLIGPDGVPQPTYSLRRFPTLASWAVDLLLIDQVWPDNPITRRYLAWDLDRDVDHDAEQPAAACLLVRRAAFDAVGGFDTQFHPAWFEDVDFCRRLRLAGYRIRYVAGARIVHEGGVAMRALSLGSFSTIWYRNLLRYAAKHGGLLTRIAIRPLLIVGMGLRVAISAARGRFDDARAYAKVIGVALGR